MMAEPADPPVYRALLALKPDDLSLGRWAEKAHLARNYFNGLRKHGKPNNASLEALLDVIGVSLAEFDAAMHPVRAEVTVARRGTRDVHRAYFGEEAGPPLKLLGTAMGGEFGDLDQEIEMTELFLFDVIAHVSRPASLAGDMDAYALTITGDSMAPRYRPKEQVAVTPRAPVAIGDDVIVQLRGVEGETERIKMVLIKELVRRTGSYVELRQYNPDRIFRVEAARVAKLHKVAGRLF